MRDQLKTPKVLNVFAHSILLIFASSFIGQSQSVRAENLCNHSKASLESRTIVGAMNRGQQAYFLENNRFGSTIALLELGISERTKCYQYLTRSQQEASFQYGIPLQPHGITKRNILGIPAGNQKILLPSYIGAVFPFSIKQIGSNTAQIQRGTIAILCVSKQPLNKNTLPLPVNKQGKLTCAVGTEQVGNFVAD